jgi:transposase
LRNLSENLNIGWASVMMKFLYDTNTMVHEAGGVLSPSQQESVFSGYDDIIKMAEKETPEEPKTTKKRGRPKKSTARNLLERLINYKQEVLRFAIHPAVSFTNNFA